MKVFLSLLAIFLISSTAYSTNEPPNSSCGGSSYTVGATYTNAEMGSNCTSGKASFNGCRDNPAENEISYSCIPTANAPGGIISKPAAGGGGVSSIGGNDQLQQAAPTAAPAQRNKKGLRLGAPGTLNRQQPGNFLQ